MKTHYDLVQGEGNWFAYRINHDNASEAAAVLGLSKTMTRTELLHMKHTGLGKEFSDWVQRNVLDYGHEVEAKVRRLIEAMINEELYSVTCSDGRLSASLDGLTMSEEIAFECKQWNAEIAAQVTAGIMPEQHMPQCQQILMVTGAEKLIFAVGDGTPENLLTLDVFPDPVWFERIRAGWAQFAIDLAAYTPPPVVVEAVGRTPETLPALHIEVTGMVTASNLADYKAHALAVFSSINRELETDQQFADAEKAVKWCGDVEARLAAAKQHALSQTESIDALFRAIDDISAEAKRTRLELDKLVKARKEAVRGEIVTSGIAALREHVAALNACLGKPYMPAVSADFAGVIKGKRTIDSLNNAVDTLLANTKIEASATADRIQANLTTLRELAAGHAFLFSDTAQIVLKAPDDLTALVKLRIAEHQVAEEKKTEELQEHIRKEEVARLEREKAEAAATELKAAQALPDDAELSPPAQALNKQEGARRFTAVHPLVSASAPNVVSMPLRTAAPADTGAKMKLGEVNARLAPIALTAEGLASLGFTPVATDKNAKLYRVADLGLICAALLKHVGQVQAKLAA